MAVDPVTGAFILEGIRQAFNMFGANQAASASKDAARVQSEAALKAAKLMADTQREALGFQRDVFNQTRADQQPWISAGQGSVNKLAHLMGINMGGGFTPLAGGGGAARVPMSPDERLESRGQIRTGGAIGGSLPAPMAREYGVPAAAYRWPGMHSAAPEDYKAPLQPRKPRPGFVRPRTQVLVASPDGEIQPVDPEEVEMFVQAGGKVVG